MTKKIVFLIALLLIAVLLAIGIFFAYQKFFAQKSSRAGIGETGLDIIQKDFEEGKIGLEAKLLNKLYFVFQDERLPEKYKTDAAPFEPGDLFYEISYKFNQLSPNAQEQIKPFLLRPDDPESYLYKKYDSTEKTGWFIKRAQAQTQDRPTKKEKFKFIETDDGKIKVWYPVEGVFTYSKFLFEKDTKKIAEKIVGSLNKAKAYEKFKNLLQVAPYSDGTLGGDDKIDIYIDYDIKVYGAMVIDFKKKSSFVLINPEKTKIDKLLHATTAHELFHVFQEVFNVVYSKAKDLWWMEATAVWAEDYIYPAYNTEQEYIDNFLLFPWLSLNNTGQAFEYGAYLFPFYISLTYGDEAIQQIFKARDFESSVINAVDKYIDGGLDENFKEFTLWNFNLRPADNYTDSGGFPRKKTSMLSKATIWIHLKKAEAVNGELYAMNPLSSQTFIITTDEIDNKVKSAAFENIKNFEGQKNAGMKVIVYPKSGEPYIEDWKDVETRKFCFNNAKENFKRIVLIFNNSSKTSKTKKAKLTIRTRNACDRGSYIIEQTDKVTARQPESYYKLHGVPQIQEMDITVTSKGEMISEPKDDWKTYPYIGKWRVEYTYDEAWRDFPHGDEYGVCTFSGTEYRYSGTFEFNLNEAEISPDGSFTVMVTEAIVRPSPIAYMKCTDGIVSEFDNITPLNNNNARAIYRGYIYDMAEDGAKIKFPTSHIYGNDKYKTYDKMIELKIKRTN